MSNPYDVLLEARKERVDIEGCPPIYVREILLGADSIISASDSKASAIISSSCVDEQGKPIWSYERATQLPKRLVNPLLEAFYRVNGLSLEAIQDAEKN